MDHPYGFPSAQPYHDFGHIPSISGLEHHGTPLAGFSTSLHQTAHSFLDSPISPIQSSLSPQQRQSSHQRYYGVENSMNPVKGDGGTSEEDGSMTSSQSRLKAQRKAQNRAAQQAFRKRKEMHVKELETKLASLEATQQQVLAENEHLKQDLYKITAENEILRATCQISSRKSDSMQPATFNAAKFYANFIPNQTSKKPSRAILSKDGERLLDARAAWDFIINHRLFKKGLVDVGDVSERLRHYARYKNHRLVLPKRSIFVAIEQSVASRTDDLL